MYRGSLKRRRAKGREATYRYRIKHRDRYLQLGRAYGRRRKPRLKIYRNKLKSIVLDKYGGKCACCGDTHYEFLCIDHVKGGGNKHRREVLKSCSHGHALYRWIIRNNFPRIFRILCANCNQAIGIHGYCPHQKVENPEIVNT